ncbi:MAG: tetratricopeptide repeat protein [Blastocatellia bacterium]|nr:tetratricopeptide repeat protein [Blastocatellia bacterium]
MQSRNLRVIAFIALLLVAAAGLPLNVDGQTRAEIRRSRELADQGNKAYREKDFKAAIQFYGEAITLVPTNPQLHFYKADAHYQLKEYAAAEREFQLALTQGHKPLEVYSFRWYVFFDQQKYDQAIDDLNKALQLAPKNAQHWKALGEAYLQNGNRKNALEATQRALLINPKDGDSYYQVARIQALEGNTTAQLAAAEEAVKRGTQFIGDTYYLIGDAQTRLRNDAAAIDAYNRAIAANPKIFQVYLTLAALYQKQNKLSLAIDTLNRAKPHFPSNGRLYTDISWYYSLADRPADAVAAARSATQLLPSEYMGYTNLCRALNDTKEYRDAITACNNALRLKPGDGETLFYLGRANDLLGRTVEATRYYRQAVTGLVEFTNANQDYADGFYLLGNAYFADNQRDRAIEAYTKCLALNPNFVKARFNLGIIQLLKKNKAAALEQHKFLLAQDAALAAKLKAEIDK